MGLPRSVDTTLAVALDRRMKERPRRYHFAFAMKKAKGGYKVDNVREYKSRGEADIASLTMIARYGDVAGAHRLEALRQLGRDSADCYILPEDPDLAELWEIDENFVRAELTDAQRANHHVRREAIMVRRGMVAAPGQGGDRRSTDKLSVDSYAAQTAVALGVDERTVRRDLARANNIAPEVMDSVTGTDLDKGVVLDELARTPKAEQPAKVSEIASRRLERRHNRSTVRMADEPLNDFEATERHRAAIMAAWNRAPPDVREWFREQVLDRPVFDRGNA